MLTGKDVYEAASPLLVAQGYESLEWDHAPQEFYNGVAASLNAQFFVPMQGQIKALARGERETLSDALTVISDLQGQIANLKTLVKDYMDLVGQRIGIVNQIPPAGWSNKAIELELRAQQLLGEGPAKS